MHPKIKKNIIRTSAAIVILLVAGATAFTLWLNNRYPDTPSSTLDDAELRSTTKTVKTPAASALAEAATTNATAQTARRGRTELTEEEKAALARVEQITAALTAALESENKAATLEEARALINHEDPDVRQKVVEALAWMEMGGFVDLCRMLFDPDADVAAAARQAWGLQMSVLEDKPLKTQMAKAAAEAALDRDPEFFDEVMGTLHELDDHQAVGTLQGLLNQAQDAEYIEKIINELNFYTTPEDPIERKEDAAKAVLDWQKRLLEEAAAEESLNH